MIADRYYSREKDNYLFYSILPSIFALEILFYSLSLKTTKLTINITVIVCLALALCTITLILIQIHSVRKFEHLYSELDVSQQRKIEKAAAGSFKTGNLLITDEVILQYGMFIKKIVPVKDIREVRLLDAQMEMSSRFSIMVKGNSIELLLASGEKTKLKGPALYTGDESRSVCKVINQRIKDEKILESDLKLFEDYRVNPPYNGIMSVVLAGMLLFLLRIYPVVLLHIFPDYDDIKLLLLHSGYEYVIGSAFIILFLATVIILLVLRNKFVRRDQSDWFSGNIYAAVIGICVIALISNLSSGKLYSAEIAREDYQLYKNREYESVITKLYVLGGTPSKIEWANFNTDQIIEKHDINVRYLKTGQEIFYLFQKNVLIEEHKEYEVKYLKNTHIIVDMKEHNTR